MSEDKTTTFEKLQQVKCETKKLGKHNLTYISWADAWTELKKIQPKAQFCVHENPDTGMPYFRDDAGGFVKVTVSIKELDGETISHTVHLAIMDHTNRAVSREDIHAMHVQKAIQRALTKAIALHGLGMYVYRGEDLPTEGDTPQPKKKSLPEDQPKKQPAPAGQGQSKCFTCGKPVTDNVAAFSYDKYNKVLCMEHQREARR